jgi:aminoglycoside phosphotransferase (APT) family kinase protein
LRYLAKLQQHLQHQGLLSTGDYDILEREGQSWQERLNLYPDRLVLIHGDATPTNFLFADQTAVALDVERMRVGDRLWDLSWVAGELKHAWGWRRGNWQGSEGAIGHFFRAYFHCLPANEQLAERIFRLNPFYMALAELRIARNSYLSWAYRRELVFEALRCMSGDRGL